MKLTVVYTKLQFGDFKEFVNFKSLTFLISSDCNNLWYFKVTLSKSDAIT